MKTEFDFGREYAEFLQSDSTVNIDNMATSSRDIPDDDYRAMVDSGINNPNSREYWRGFNSYSAGVGSEKNYMNIATGSVDTYDGWDYTTEDGDQVNAVDLGEVVEVIKVNGQWVEV